MKSYLLIIDDQGKAFVQSLAVGEAIPLEKFLIGTEKDRWEIEMRLITREIENRFKKFPRSLRTKIINCLFRRNITLTSFDSMTEREFKQKGLGFGEKTIKIILDERKNRRR